jgi:hypothetical protein
LLVVSRAELLAFAMKYSPHGADSSGAAWLVLRATASCRDLSTACTTEDRGSKAAMSTHCKRVLAVPKQTNKQKNKQKNKQTDKQTNNAIT